LAFRGDGEAPLIDVGSITSLGDGTDRGFGSVVGLAPKKGWAVRSSLRAPLAAAAVVASVGLLAAAIVVLAGGREPAQRVYAALGPWLASADLEERLAELHPSPDEVVDLDGAEPDRPVEQATARSTPAPGTNAIVRPTPKTTTPPAPAESPPPKNRRGEAELGF